MEKAKILDNLSAITALIVPMVLFLGFVFLFEVNVKIMVGSFVASLTTSIILKKIAIAMGVEKDYTLQLICVIFILLVLISL